ncbi:MAG: hypothetical protein BMS9Abin15_0050 [Gammaproteobacteria bacterium]|nr:MAG: hypothetical protein BMS9Abin15_0050 [Gammaproteobacteria bacterium]
MAVQPLPASSALAPRQLLHALLYLLRPCSRASFSTIAPALFYLRPSMGSYLLHLPPWMEEMQKDCREQSLPRSRASRDTCTSFGRRSRRGSISSIYLHGWRKCKRIVGNNPCHGVVYIVLVPRKLRINQSFLSFSWPSVYRGRGIQAPPGHSQ